MAAQQQTPMSARLPPDLPADASTSGALGVYLRNFALWCRNGFAEQMRNNEALQGLMLRGYDTPAGQNPKIWMLEVNQAGQLGLGPMALGSQADPGPFVPVAGSNTPPPGVTDGSDAAAGQVGEVISSAVAPPGVPLTNATARNITSISLPAGDWDIYGDVWVTSSAGMSNGVGAINIVSATLPTAPAPNVARLQLTVVWAGGIFVTPLRPCRASVAATTIYYLVGYGAFASGTCTAGGCIWARRAR